MTEAERSGRPSHLPENATTAPHMPNRSAAHSAKLPSSVMTFSGSGLLGLVEFRLVAGTTLREHFGGTEHVVLAQSTLDDHLDVVGVGEGVGHQAAIGHRILLRAVADAEVHLLVLRVLADGA